jgi:hypothetical protein
MIEELNKRSIVLDQGKIIGDFSQAHSLRGGV